MEIRLHDGRYVADGRGGHRTVTGAEELLQRILFKLTARRGSFPMMPELGSRLYLLPGIKKSQRQAAAEQYIAEALEGEAVSVSEVTVREGSVGLELQVDFRYEGERLSLTLSV